MIDDEEEINLDLGSVAKSISFNKLQGVRGSCNIHECSVVRGLAFVAAFPLLSLPPLLTACAFFGFSKSAFE